MTERFKKAYDALYNAFMTDTLAKGICAACAVGNIVAAAQGGEITQEEGFLGELLYECNTDNSFWGNLFVTFDGEQEKEYEHADSEPKIALDIQKLESLTGYTVKEMAEVEYAFETNTEISYENYPYCKLEEIMEDQFKGLMAVMDVLIKLDEVAEGQQYKDTFKNKFQTV